MLPYFYVLMFIFVLEIFLRPLNISATFYIINSKKEDDNHSTSFWLPLYLPAVGVHEWLMKDRLENTQKMLSSIWIPFFRNIPLNCSTVSPCRKYFNICFLILYKKVRFRKLIGRRLLDLSTVQFTRETEPVKIN